MRPTLAVFFSFVALSVAINEQTDVITKRLKSEFQQKFDEQKKEFTKQNKEQNSEIEELRYQLYKLANVVNEHLSCGTTMTNFNLEKRITVLEGSLGTLQDQVDLINTNVVALIAQMGGVMLQLADMQDAAHNIRQITEDLEADNADNKQGIADLDRRMQDVETSVNNDTRICSIEKTIAQLKTEINSNDQDMEEMKTDLGNSKVILSGVQSDIETTGQRYAFLAATSRQQSAGHVVFDNVHYNMGDVYDASTGQWTAPVDGIFHFTATVRANSNVANNCFVSLHVDGVDTVDERSQETTSGDKGDNFSITLNVNLNLLVGQKVHVSVSYANYVYHDNHVDMDTWFMGNIVQYSL